MQLFCAGVELLQQLLAFLLQRLQLLVGLFQRVQFLAQAALEIGQAFRLDTMLAGNLV